jgi:hypothetical protein
MPRSSGPHGWLQVVPFAPAGQLARSIVPRKQIGVSLGLPVLASGDRPKPVSLTLQAETPSRAATAANTLPKAV